MLRAGSLTLLVFLAAVVIAAGHDGQPKWLSEDALDDGVFVGLGHPRVVRDRRPFDVQVLVNNVRGGSDVAVTAVRFRIGGEARAEARRFQRTLRSQRERFDRYRAVQDRLSHAGGRSPELAASALIRERANLMSAVASASFVARHSVKASQLVADSSAFEISVEVDLSEDGATRTIHRNVTIPIESPLPNGTGPRRVMKYDAKTGSLLSDSSSFTADTSGGTLWFAGDQHLHTAFSIDAFFTSGTTDTVTGYANTAQVAGLDWIIVTDHSNVDVDLFGSQWYTPEQFAFGAAEAELVRDTSGFLVLYGQEMGVGALGLFGEPAHMLAYPRTTDSTGFIANPCSGLVFNHVNCEAEQIILDRVNNAGGIGFIAHPFDEGALSKAPWDFDSGATGWAGMEVFNGGFGADDFQALLKWFELLLEIPAPRGGSLPPRVDFPTPFPVALGNSDAHEPGLIGRTFTYCRLSEVSRESVMNAFVHGNCVASNGPLGFATINGAGPGDVALVDTSGNTLAITLETTPEFGPVGDYATSLFANGVLVATLPPSGAPEFTTTLVFENVDLAAEARFINVVASTADGTRMSIANPVWLEFGPES